MTCATCGKQPIRETIATKTRKVGKHIVVECQRQALVCACGVLAWDPPTPSPAPVLPNPARPWEHPNFPSMLGARYLSPATIASRIAMNVATVTYHG
jgi:hypothetical protein